MASLLFMIGYVIGIGIPVGIGITIAYFVNKKLSGKKKITSPQS